MSKQSDYLVNAVSKGNLLQIHNELCSIIHKDPTFRTTEFIQALRYAQSAGTVQVIQPHNLQSFEPKEKWNKQYWALLVSELMDNFSDERIQHLKEVGIHLYGSRDTTSSSRTEYAGVRETGYQPHSSPMMGNSGMTIMRRKSSPLKKNRPIVVMLIALILLIILLATIGIVNTIWTFVILLAIFLGTAYLLKNKRRWR